MGEIVEICLSTGETYKVNTSFHPLLGGFGPSEHVAIGKATKLKESDHTFLNVPLFFRVEVKFEKNITEIHPNPKVNIAREGCELDGGEIMYLTQALNFPTFSAQELMKLDDLPELKEYVVTLTKHYSEKRELFDKNNADGMNDDIYVQIFQNFAIDNLFKNLNNNEEKIEDLLKNEIFISFFSKKKEELKEKKSSEHNSRKSQIVNEIVKESIITPYVIVTEKSVNEQENAIAKAIRLELEFANEVPKLNKLRTFYIISNNHDSHWLMTKCTVDPDLRKINLLVIDSLGNQPEISENNPFFTHIALPENYQFGICQYMRTAQQKDFTTCGIRAAFNLGFISKTLDIQCSESELKKIAPDEKTLRIAAGIIFDAFHKKSTRTTRLRELPGFQNY